MHCQVSNLPAEAYAKKQFGCISIACTDPLNEIPIIRQSKFTKLGLWYRNL